MPPAQTAPGGGAQQIGQIGDLVLQQQIIPGVQLHEHLVDLLRRDRLIGAAVEENAVLAVRLDLNDGVALRNVGMLQIAQIDAAAGQQLCQPCTLRAEQTRVMHLLPAA